nr:MAG TPA: hypothetical protein [Caudoviricetes sp.]
MHAGFCHFTRVRVNKHIPLFTGGGFLTLSPSPGFICCVSNCKGNASLSPPTAGKQRFDSVTQHNQLPSFAWIYSPKPPLLFPALDAMVRHDIAKSSG